MPTLGDLHNDADFDPPRPPDMGTGLLPRRFRPGEICGYAREQSWFPRMTKEEIEASIAAGVNQRDQVRYVYSQNGYGSCASHAIAGKLSILGMQEFGQFIVYNALPVYRLISGGRDNGSSLDANLDWARTKGFPPDVDWPMWRRGKIKHGYHDLPPDAVWETAKLHRIDEFWEVQSLMEARIVLALGFALYAGIPGHAIDPVGLLTWEKAEWLNSWARSWGDNGFGKVNLSELYTRYGMYCARSRIALPSGEVERIMQAQRALPDEYQEAAQAA